jgi:polysaccharide pyruvyl transferase WcaK-like protein
MRILIDPGTTNCRNIGDVAVLQAAVTRLREFRPDAAIDVLTADPAELERHCPDTQPVDELARRRLLGREFGEEPRRHSARGRPLDRFRGLVRGIGRQRASRAAAQAVADRLDDTDLFVACGQATLADADRVHALRLLRTALLAQRRGIPSAFFSQGIGPLSDAGVLELAGSILGAALVVGVREQLAAPPILARLGIPADRVLVTGDDAIEAAWAARPSGLGAALGVHLRIAPLAARSHDLVERLRPVVQSAARAHGAALIPLPISHHLGGGAYDPATIRTLLAGYDDASDGGAGLTTPAQVTAAAGRCRTVVTGAYHAAVFALAQGIPAVCLGRSPYYLQKFHGLVNGFGAGCQVLDLDSPDLEAELRSAIDHAWERAAALRPALLAAAESRIEAARDAYALLFRRIDSGVVASAAREASSW